MKLNTVNTYNRSVVCSFSSKYVEKAVAIDIKFKFWALKINRTKQKIK